MTQRFFDCSVAECERPSARSVGAGCDMCSRHFCAVHMSPDFHGCSLAVRRRSFLPLRSVPADMAVLFQDLDDESYDALMAAEVGRLRAQINEKAVCDLASSLNGGSPCVVEYPTKAVGPEALTGCANYHVRLRFTGTSATWLMRVPRVTGFSVGLPVSLAEYLVQSEYATLKFLETTSVPAPRAFSFGIPSAGTDHGIGVCFLIMEELPGKPWDGGGDASKVWQGLADILAELEKHPLDRAGSLYVQTPNDPPTIAATASDRFVCINPFGPFHTSQAYYAAWAGQYLELIRDGQLYPQFPVEAYLVYRFLLDNVHQLCDVDAEQGFFLKHVDDKGDHLMVDQDLNITGVIDWQMARVVPKREAFALSLVSADMAALCDGHISLSARDGQLRDALREGSPQLAKYMVDEKVRRFFWGLGLEAEWDCALPLAQAILGVFGVQQSWAEWKQGALQRYSDDEGLRDLVFGAS